MTRHLVTGAGSGIGAAVVELLRSRGDEVIALTRADVDLADTSAVQAWAANAGLSSLDSLVHSAGVVDLGPVADFSLEEWQAALAVNLVSPAALTSALLPALRAARGSVVFVNSTAGLNANAQWSSYAASKWGLRAFADSLRAEERSIRVTTVFPGRTATKMQAAVHAAEGASYDPARWIRPETVAAAIVGVIDQPRDVMVPELVLRPTP